MPSVRNVFVRDAVTKDGIGGAGVMLFSQDQANPASASRTTMPGSGHCNFGDPGYVRDGMNCVVVAPGHESVSQYITGDGDPLVVEVPPLARPFDVRESGYLTADAIEPTSGLVSYFRDENGRRWPFVGFTLHTAIVNVANGNEVPLHWYLDWMDQNGFNTVISIGCHLSPFKQANGLYYDPRRADHPQILARLFNICAEHKKRIAHASLADAQGLSLADKQAIWQRDCYVARDRWNVMPRKGNERKVNGWHPDELPWWDVGRCLRSNGSTGGAPWPNFGGSSFLEWEPRRDPNQVHKAMDDAGAGTREMQHGFVNSADPDASYPDGVPFPIIAVEPAYFHETDRDWWGDERWTSVQHAHDLGANIGCNSAGGGFGCSAGLELRELGPNAAACGEAFARGLWSAFGGVSA